MRVVPGRSIKAFPYSQALRPEMSLGCTSHTNIWQRLGVSAQGESCLCCCIRSTDYLSPALVLRRSWGALTGNTYLGPGSSRYSSRVWDVPRLWRRSESLTLGNFRQERLVGIDLVLFSDQAASSLAFMIPTSPILSPKKYHQIDIPEKMQKGCNIYPSFQFFSYF